MMKKPAIKKKDLVYPDLSYKIVGVLFEVYNILGPGLSEKHYHRAVAEALRNVGLKFQEQAYRPIHYQGSTIGKQFFDFLVEGKVVLELKKGQNFSRRNIQQTATYLKTSGHRLAILANFGRDGVLFKRIVNLDS